MCRKNCIKRLGFISLVLLLVSASACAWPISELSGAQASQEKAPGMSSAQVQTAPQAVLSSLSVEQAKDLEKLKSELESSATSLAESKALLAQQSAELAILRAEIESLQGLSEASSAATAALQAAYDELEAQAMKLQAERDEYYARAVKAEAQSEGLMSMTVGAFVTWDVQCAWGAGVDLGLWIKDVGVILGAEYDITAPLETVLDFDMSKLRVKAGLAFRF